MAGPEPAVGITHVAGRIPARRIHVRYLTAVPVRHAKNLFTRPIRGKP